MDKLSRFASFDALTLKIKGLTSFAPAKPVFYGPIINESNPRPNKENRPLL